MNLAKQLEENDATLRVESAAQPSNIIALPESEPALRSLETYGMSEVFVDHQFSALNEW